MNINEEQELLVSVGIRNRHRCGWKSWPIAAAEHVKEKEERSTAEPEAVLDGKLYNWVCNNERSASPNKINIFV